MAHQSATDSGYRTKPLLDFVTGLIAREDAVLRDIRESTPAKGLPPISVGPDEGRLLHFFASSCNAKKIVEVGTLAGYSACWLARALPKGGMLHSIEFDPKQIGVVADHEPAGADVFHGPLRVMLVADLIRVDENEIKRTKFFERRQDGRAGADMHRHPVAEPSAGDVVGGDLSVFGIVFD